MQSRSTSTAPATPAATDPKNGTVVKDSRALSEGQAQAELEADPTEDGMDLTEGPVGSLGLTEEEMESELASIETQRRLVMLARRLATAREEQARGFLPVETIPTTTASRPREPAALAAKSADSAREANTTKEEAQLPVSKISLFKEEAQLPVSKVSLFKEDAQLPVSKISMYKEEAQLPVPKISLFKDVFRNYNDIRQRSGESLDSLVDRINALEAQMPIQPEEARVRTLLFALPLSTQHVILKRQSNFATRNELQKLAAELEAFEAKQHHRDRGWRNDGRGGLHHTEGGSRTPFRVSKGSAKSPVMGAKGVSSRSERRGRNKDLSHIVCYNCERPGHYAGDCPEQRKERPGSGRAH